MKKLWNDVPVFGRPVVLVVDRDFIGQLFAMGYAIALMILLLVATWRMAPVVWRVAGFLVRNVEEMIDDQPQPKKSPTTLVAIPDSCLERR